MPKFEFDEEKHLYTLDGRRLVSATECLSLVDDRWKDPYYLQRGKFLHLARHLWDMGELDESTVDDQIRGRLEGWKKFRSDTGFVPSMSEQFFYHPVYLYGFKFDVHGPLNDHEVLIDVKSSFARVDALQGAAYCAGLEAQTPPIKCDKAFDIYLNKNGTYKLEPIKYIRSNFQTFLAVLTAYRWKEEI